MASFPFDHAVAALRAVAEPTRLRVVAALWEIELTVGELCHVLGQTQPRVSRHLRVLGDAGLIERQAEGSFAFYRPTSDPVGYQLVVDVLARLEHGDPTLENDRDRIGRVRAERAEQAAAYFEEIAGRWDAVREQLVADGEVEKAVLELMGDGAVGHLLDIGTGTGRILELAADRIERGTGIDLSREMLNLARSRLDQLGHRHCSVLHASAYDLGLDPESVDVAVMHHVLHFLDDPAGAIAQAARALVPGGSLIVVDFAPHGEEWFRDRYQHRYLGFDEDTVVRWCRRAGLDGSVVHRLARDADDALTTLIWHVTKPIDWSTQ
jgi:ubiquinone/menaquinone biosynthesis C-methylase UbiE